MLFMSGKLVMKTLGKIYYYSNFIEPYSGENSRLTLFMAFVLRQSKNVFCQRGRNYGEILKPFPNVKVHRVYKLSSRKSDGDLVPKESIRWKKCTKM